jgi:hypothetical protein
MGIQIFRDEFVQGIDLSYDIFSCVDVACDREGDGIGIRCQKGTLEIFDD